MKVRYQECNKGNPSGWTSPPPKVKGANCNFAVAAPGFAGGGVSGLRWPPNSPESFPSLFKTRVQLQFSQTGQKLAGKAEKQSRRRRDVFQFPVADFGTVQHQPTPAQVTLITSNTTVTSNCPQISPIEKPQNPITNIHRVHKP